MANTSFNWNFQDILITYDLSDNNVSASQIADASNGLLHTKVTIKESHCTYLLPNTTLWFSGSIERAKSAFIAAFNKAKPLYSSCKINKLLISEVNSQFAYIED